MLSVLAREPLAWALAAFYFLTFGGFVAFSYRLDGVSLNDYANVLGGNLGVDAIQEFSHTEGYAGRELHRVAKLERFPLDRR